ncbi:PREDICTED: uncharacterized protein LOC109476945 [Branchiostoma belcheri]|uniref:Uncharacterized protein LOC109476945 n=1 Tax=Branchiostoma belcheri TaxID=7741 RepID=A0A6P4ZRF7_BRABE|nr:PREDICTED: uncharacterized protein LOC109476945 [Branchiostoma belcheri]
MNWVGGARSRLRMKYEKKQQKDYFERKRYSRQVRTVRPQSPGATHRKGGISQDLLYLHTLNTAHSMDKKGSLSDPSSRQVNKVDLSKVNCAFPMRRQEDLELPNMSPDYSKTPSLLQLADPTDSKPPCQHYMSYDDWLTSSSGKMRNDTPDSAVPLGLFDQSTRLSAVAPHTSNSGVQSLGTPFVPYTTPGPKAYYKDPFRKFASSSSLVKFEEGTHTPDPQHGHDFEPAVPGIVNPPRTPGSSHKRRKLARIPSSGRSVRTPSTFSSSSQSSFESPVKGGTQDKNHKEEHRPILLQKSAQSQRPSLHNWLSSISRDTEKSGSHPNNTTPSTTDEEILPAEKRRKLDFGEACSTDDSQQRAAVICSDNQAQPEAERDLKLNPWNAVYREGTTDERFSINVKPESPATLKQNTYQTTENPFCQKGYQATLQNLMSMPLTWANQQPTGSKQKKESTAVAEEALYASTQQFVPGSAPRTEEVLNTPTKEINQRSPHHTYGTHFPLYQVRDPSASHQLQTLEEGLTEPQSTLTGVTKTAMGPDADTSGVERDVSDCLQLILTLVECEDFNTTPEVKHQDGPVIRPMTTPRQIPDQFGANALVGSKDTSEVESVFCPGSTDEIGRFLEGEVLVKEVIDSIIKDALDMKMLNKEKQYKTSHREETSERQGLNAEEQDTLKTDGHLSHESGQFGTEIREEKTQKYQQMQTVTKTEDTGTQTEDTTDNSHKSEMMVSGENEQDTCGSLGKISLWSDKSTQTRDQEGSVLEEESGFEVEECELRARAVLEKVKGLPEPCRREKRLLMMLNDMEELIVKLESAHILQSLKEGTSASN